MVRSKIALFAIACSLAAASAAAVTAVTAGLARPLEAICRPARDLVVSAFGAIVALLVEAFPARGFKALARDWTAVDVDEGGRARAYELRRLARTPDRLQLAHASIV